MRLSKIDLLKKFPYLHKFANTEWIEEISMSGNQQSKEIPFIVCKALMNDLLEFIEDTKFTSSWEAGFSLKIRIKQIYEIIDLFSRPDEESITLKPNEITRHLHRLHRPAPDHPDTAPNLHVEIKTKIQEDLDTDPCH